MLQPHGKAQDNGATKELPTLNQKESIVNKGDLVYVVRCENETPLRKKLM
jgi:hypothetical protein